MLVLTVPLSSAPQIRDSRFVLSYELPGAVGRQGESCVDAGAGCPAEALVATSATSLSTLMHAPTFWLAAKYVPRY